MEIDSLDYMSEIIHFDYVTDKIQSEQNKTNILP